MDAGRQTKRVRAASGELITGRGSLVEPQPPGTTAFDPDRRAIRPVDPITKDLRGVGDERGIGPDQRDDEARQGQRHREVVIGHIANLFATPDPSRGAELDEIIRQHGLHEPSVKPALRPPERLLKAPQFRSNAITARHRLMLTRRHVAAINLIPERGGTEQPFEDHDILPAAVTLAMILVKADLPETAALCHTDRGSVGGKDAADDLEVSVALGSTCELT